MLNIKRYIEYIQKALNMPPKQAIKKTKNVLIRDFLDIYHYHRDRKNDTFCKQNDNLASIHSYIKALPMKILNKNQILSLAQLYINHQFDILGSGWINVKHGIECQGLHGHRYQMGKSVYADSKGIWLNNRINQSNREKSKSIWSQISNTIYQPIDWQLDFKSGYRWSEKCWYKKIRYGNIPGVDVKIPRELSRMHHLTQLAFAYGITKNNKYLVEFRCQILDFISTNPPRYGVNWESTMDVAIRAANWLISFDFFISYGAVFDDTFLSIFKKSIFEHGVHIVSNIEWNEELRGNHYLSNIVGLLFVAAYLPDTYETNLWLSFAVHELINEVYLQFNSDGSNFEASTCYHRLSSEMVIYATALISGFPRQKINALKSYDSRRIKNTCKINVPTRPLFVIQNHDQEGKLIFPTIFLERIERMAEFTMHITKMNNQVSQIGDNDSGRFCKLQPVYSQLKVKEAKSMFSNLKKYSSQKDHEIYLFENHLDHRHLVSAFNGLYNRVDFSDFTKEFYEDIIISQLSNNTILTSNNTKNSAEDTIIGTLEDRLEFKEKFQRQLKAIKPIHFRLPDGAIQDLKRIAYPDFGLYIFRSKLMYLSVRCGTIGQNGNGGHAHNDQLSLELQINGTDIIRDPGTYLYTPLPEIRNQYRSIMAHFAPFMNDLKNEKIDTNLFTLKSNDSAKCLFFGDKCFIGSHSERKSTVFRLVQLQTSGIDIFDFIIEPSGKCQNNINEDSKNVSFSDGYGICRVV